jgi:hypothetical protein
VRANGGKVLEEKTQIGPHGFRTLIVDSEGNRIAGAFIGVIDQSPQKIRGAQAGTCSGSRSMSG